MFWMLALYLDFRGAKNIYVLEVLIWGFGGCWRFLTGVWNFDIPGMSKKISEHGYFKDSWPYPNQDENAKPQSGTSSILQSFKSGLKGQRSSLNLQNQDRQPKLGSWVYHGDHIQIKIQMPNPNQEPPVSSKAQNQNLKDTDVLCTFKIKLGSQNLKHRCIKDQWSFQKSVVNRSKS